MNDSLPPFEAGSETSEAAARSIAHVSEDLEARVIHCFEASPERGFTCDEVEAIFNLPHQTISARIREAVIHGMLTRTETKRPTRRGRQAWVYIRSNREMPLESGARHNPRPSPAERASFELEMHALEARGITLSEATQKVRAWVKG